MPDTIKTADGRDIPLTEDIDAVEVYATGMTVSMAQKVNLGDFENAEPYASIRAEIRPAVSLEAEDAVGVLREHAERLRRVVGWHVTNEVEAYREGRR